jgi:uncharacterized coiled-coil DUF342 family protein
MKTILDNEKLMLMQRKTERIRKINLEAVGLLAQINELSAEAEQLGEEVEKLAQELEEDA